MSWTTDLLTGLGQLLAGSGVGTWRPPGDPYGAADVTPIFLSSMPGAPDRVIVLTAYDVSHDPALSDSVQGVQVRTRGSKDPRVVEDLDDAVFDVLQGLPPTTLPTGVRVQFAERVSSTTLGADENGRHERTSNYYLTVFRPSLNRL